MVVVHCKTWTFNIPNNIPTKMVLNSVAPFTTCKNGTRSLQFTFQKLQERHSKLYWIDCNQMSFKFALE